MNAPDDGVLAKVGALALGAILTLIGQIVSRRSAQRAQAFADRLDELCEDVRELAAVAGEYWATESTSAELRRLEAKVFGLNHRVATTAALLGEERDEFRTQSQDLVVDLTEAATGGEFQVKDRAAAPQRYMRIEQKATNLIKNSRRFQRTLLRGWLR